MVWQYSKVGTYSKQSDLIVRKGLFVVNDSTGVVECNDVAIWYLFDVVVMVDGAEREERGWRGVWTSRGKNR